MACAGLELDEPGDQLFQPEPLRAAEPRFGNVAEPSTRHCGPRPVHSTSATLTWDTGDTSGLHATAAPGEKPGDTIVTPPVCW